jgi:microcystin-dependent protein
MTSYCRRPAHFAAHERPTIGDTKYSFSDYNHLGWLKCDGAWLNKSEYGLLFNVIGGTFGETSTQFRLPDPRGRVLGAVGAGAGLTAREKADLVGTETHTLTINEMPAHKHGSVDVTGNTNGNGNTTTDGEHNHGITDPQHSHSYSFPSGQTAGFTGDTVADEANPNPATTGLASTGITINSNGDHYHTMGSTGGSNAHNNMQPTLFYGNLFIYCGKVNNGSFPYTTGTDLY